MVFVNFSGGLDSTYFLWKLLSSGDRALVHHCYYSSRREFEQRACDKILEELKKMGLTNFVYERSELKFQGKPDRDVIVMASVGAFVARKYNINKVVLCYSKEESPEMDRHLARGGKVSAFNPLHRYSIANKVFQDIYRRKPLEFFFLGKKGLVSRRQMIRELPDNLLQHISFCRKPTEEKRYCGRCFACSRTLKYFKMENKTWTQKFS